MMENMIMNVIRILIIVFIIYAVFKGLKTLLKIGFISIHFYTEKATDNKHNPLPPALDYFYFIFSIT